jgi:hypothetical protein
MLPYFYVITNKINGKRYFGSGSKQFYFGSGTVLKNSILKYGKENFEMTILKSFETRLEAFKFEDRFLKLYKISTLSNTYNIKDSSLGGDTFTNNPNKENVRLKFSISQENNYLTGKTYDEVFGELKSFQIRAKLSDSHKGNIASNETLEKKSQSMKEFWKNDESKTRMLINNKFINDNPSKKEYRRIQMSNDRKGSNNPAAKKIEINGKQYESIIDAVNELKISRSTIQRKIRNTNNNNYKQL